jgi:hypothetical protein
VLVIEIGGVVVLVVCDEHARFSTALMGSKDAVRELRPDRTSRAGVTSRR